MKTINVLGTKYTVAEIDANNDERMCGCDGFCDKTTKEIAIIKKPKDTNLGCWEWYRKKILRHEIIHAFFFESGLHENFENDQFGVSETIVDWVAVQFPKMLEAFKEVGCID